MFEEISAKHLEHIKKQISVNELRTEMYKKQISVNELRTEMYKMVNAIEPYSMMIVFELINRLTESQKNITHKQTLIKKVIICLKTLFKNT